MSANFPFAAIVGQAELKDALLWIAVDPAIGGVLVTGTRGTAKSTAVRAFADLLPPLDVVAGDAFNRAPGPDDPLHARIATPFVEFPIGATEDRVIGTLDVRALLAGERRFEPGLLARANRGILYVDEVNLLPDHLVDVVLDAAAAGTNVVERDGASFAHDARIMLVGTMNPEEGELRPQLLDRFGLCVAIENDDDLDRRVEIVERRVAFERDAPAFVASYGAVTAELAERVARARASLANVCVERAQVRRAARHALAACAEGMRADLAIVRTARAIAALDGRTVVSDTDIDRAAPSALAHRRREPAAGTPPPTSPQPPDSPGDAGDRETADDPGRDDTRREPANSGATNGTPTAPQPQPQVFAIGHAVDVAGDARAGHARPSILRQRGDTGRGRGATETTGGRARAIVTTTTRIAPLATIRVAAAHANDSTGPFAIARDDVRFVQRRGRARALVVLLVDASGSMAAAARMRAAKGVVCSLLATAYRRRDSVALVAFRGAAAETLVPPTRSAVLAYRRLRTLETGGRTPLAHGLAHARELIAVHARREPGTDAHLVVVSDARANAPASGALERALHEAARVRARGIRALCVDTEAGRLRFGFAAQLARALDATYQHLDDCTERALGATVREWMATA